jgi:hypothetical protein
MDGRGQLVMLEYLAKNPDGYCGKLAACPVREVTRK